ncbi:MAG: hypothetical protein IPK27_11675 [Rhodanobacteraceae bacterium]|nr:hypothetical protein [Rhodanobacteraceae bacterium]
MTTQQAKRRPLARIIALTLALSAPLMASAQTPKETELEGRIAQLEAQLAELKALVVAQHAQHTAAAPAPAPAATPAPPGAPPPPPPIQQTTITPGAVAGTKFTVGGFVRTDMLYSNTDSGEIADGATGRDLYLPGQIPVGGSDEGTDFDSHIKFSRLWFGIDNVSDAGDKVTARVEIDFFGGALGNEVSTNTYGTTIRHAFVGWNQWLAGQTWSNFMDPAALTEAVDFIGPLDGTVFVRQPQIRYTSGPWSFSLENPETTITPFRGGTRITTDDNNLPDVTARYTHKAAWGHLSGALMVRQLAYETTGANAIDDSSFALAGTFSGRYNFDANNDLRFAINAGSGIGRYVALGVASDAVLDADGDIDGLDGVAGFVGFHHNFSPKLRGNLYYAAANYDNDTALTGTGVTKGHYSVAANLFYSPLPKLDLGAELRYAEREMESGVDGSLTRLHFLAKYSF